jgi:hypothetical protein
MSGKSLSSLVVYTNSVGVSRRSCYVHKNLDFVCELVSTTNSADDLSQKLSLGNWSVSSQKAIATHHHSSVVQLSP